MASGELSDAVVEAIAVGVREARGEALRAQAAAFRSLGDLALLIADAFEQRADRALAGELEPDPAVRMTLVTDEARAAAEAQAERERWHKTMPVRLLEAIEAAEEPWQGVFAELLEEAAVPREEMDDARRILQRYLDEGLIERRPVALPDGGEGNFYTLTEFGKATLKGARDDAD